MYQYDVLFIGSGHACWHGALTLKLAGKRVLLADSGVTGGTCTNFGCDAKILLDGPFELLDGLKNYQGLCTDSLPEIDWSRLMAYKKQQIGMLPLGLEMMFQQLGLDYKKGHARIADAHTVQIGDELVTTESIVIGAGARNARLQIPGKEYLKGSADFLSLDEMPQRIVFIGAGIISMEFASMALKLGRQVTVIEYADRALAAYPQGYVQRLLAKMQAEGADFRFNEAVCEVIQSGAGFTVRTKSGFAADCDYVLDATGRIANVEDLGLAELGIKASRRGIAVNEFMQTAVPNIYASGDVVDKAVPKLTPTAAFESDYIASHILGNPLPIQYPAVPNLVFTLPRIAQTGVTVDEADAHPELYKKVSVPYGQAMLWLARNEADCDITFIFDREKHLAGAAVYGSEAGSWIDVLTLIINKKLSAQELSQMIFAFPTPTYGLISALIPQMMQA